MSDLQTLFSNTIQTIKNSVSLQHKYPLVEVKSSVDGHTYRVRDMPDKLQAANLIASIRKKMSLLYFACIEKFPNKPQVRQWMRNFKPDADRFIEATPDAEHTSYSVNKGEKVHLCLRQREGHNESLMAENIMAFVSIHEMAHIITPTVGHGPDFWNNFAWLLKQAEEIGIYEYQDFKSKPVAYCGLQITDSPSYDPKKDGTSF
jgi:predicted metal-dependent hydrolase